MPNFLLSGISAGANQGLANLVASKRADRMAARENRRYEQELMFRIGSAEQARQEREKMFAYQKTRDAAADEQWAKSHGLQMDALSERKRANLATEELGRDTLASREEQAAADRLQRTNQFNETMKYRYDASAQAQQQFEAEQDLREQGLAESITAREQSNEIARERNQTLDNHYQAQIRIQEQKLNEPMSKLERQKIQAEIDRLKAHTELYKAQAAGEDAAKVPTVPLATGRNIAQELAGIYSEYYNDEGGRWHIPFTARDVGGGFFDKNPFYTHKVLPWDSTDPNEPTQKQKLQSIGGDMFDRMVQAYGGNVQAAYQHLDSTIDTMLASEEFGDAVIDRIRMRSPAEISDDLITLRNMARDQIRRGALLKHAELIGGATTPNTTGTVDDPALNFR